MDPAEHPADSGDLGTEDSDIQQAPEEDPVEEWVDNEAESPLPRPQLQEQAAPAGALASHLASMRRGRSASGTDWPLEESASSRVGLVACGSMPDAVSPVVEGSELDMGLTQALSAAMDLPTTGLTQALSAAMDIPTPDPALAAKEALGLTAAAEELGRESLLIDDVAMERSEACPPEELPADHADLVDNDLLGEITGLADDTVPASPETLLAAVQKSDHGTLSVADAEDCRRTAAAGDGGEAPAGNWLQAAGRRIQPTSLRFDDGADDSEDDEIAMARMQAEDSLQDESWVSLPPRERELWERVRPRSIRREAAQVRANRLPLAAIARLVSLHPELQSRSKEAVELINCSTVLLLQAVARAAWRQRATGAQRVQFEDLRQACLSNRELQFLMPLQGSLDASALTSRGDAGHMVGEDELAEAPEGEKAGANAAVRSGVRHRVGRSAAGTNTGHGQHRLNAAAFAKSARPQNVDTMTEDVVATPPSPQRLPAAPEDVPGLQMQTPAREADAALKAKRRREDDAAEKGDEGLGSAQKAPAQKAPRRTTAHSGSKRAGPSLASFFKRTPATEATVVLESETASV